MEEKMEVKTYTKKQVLEITIDILRDIPVPMRMKQMIADPLQAAINNLMEIHRVLGEEEQMAQDAEKEPVELQVIKEEPENDERETLSETEEPGTP